MRTNLFPIFSFVFLMICTLGCNKAKESDSSFSRSENIKLKQYMVHGERLYQQHCGNCHQENGEGLARLIPPLKGSDFLSGDHNKFFCIIKYGLKGEISVNGVMYNQPMPGNSTLTNLEIAEISTYVLNGFIGQKILLSPSTVEAGLASCDQD